MENVAFTSKMDRQFKMMISVIIVIFIVIFGPVFIVEREMTTTDMWLAIGGCIFTIALILWFALDITYKFTEDYLYLRVGFLFTRIRYEDIESYRYFDGLMDVGSGFNLLSSTKGLAILSQKVVLGEVKISPSDREDFIRELDKRIQAVK